jgi:hypothetical protein
MRVAACLAVVFSVLFGTTVLAPPASAGFGKAGVVVVHGNGDVVTDCVKLDKAEITGFGLLKRSRFEFKAASFDSLGKAICWLDGEGVNTTDPNQCFSDPDGAFWGYWKQNKDDPAPKASNSGPELRRVRRGSVDYWVWDTYPQPAPAPVSLSTICATG